MILVPLPFVVSLLLITLLVQAFRRDAGGVRAAPLFVALLAAYALQSILIGLRWGYDLRGVLVLMSPLAALIAPLAWASFAGLTREGAPGAVAGFLPHLLPMAAVIVLMVLWPDPVGVVIVAVFVAYGLALLWAARLGPDVLVASRLDGSLRSFRAMRITGVALLASALTDILIGLDLAFGSGAHSGAVVSAANVLALLVLGAAASLASSDTVEVEAAGPAAEPPTPPEPTQDERSLLARVESLMRDEELYRDADLNLDRIARRLRLPARDVSGAINRAHGASVSQYVNAFRVERACRLLRETADPVTQVMFEAGFGTKSNFNREFGRIVGMTPSAYRRAESQPALAS